MVLLPYRYSDAHEDRSILVLEINFSRLSKHRHFSVKI